jgi:hypothetical protein
MKKKLIVSAVLIIVAAIVTVNISIVAGTPRKSGYFSITDYVDQLKNPDFQSIATFGLLAKSDQALAAARELFEQRFSYEPKISLTDPVAWEIRQDKETGAWYVKSYKVLPFTEGSTYHAILSSGGTVLAVWVEK